MEYFDFQLVGDALMKDLHENVKMWIVLFTKKLIGEESLFLKGYNRSRCSR